VAGGAAEDARRSTFEGDARLTRPVTVSLLDRTLAQALPEVGRLVGVELKARREVADRKIVLVAHQRPAAETLDRLAAHLDFIWLRAGAGYELGQSLLARQREAAEEAAEALRAEETMRRWIERLGRLVALSPGQMRSREDALSKRAANLSGAEAIAAREEAQALRELGQPAARTAVTALTALSSAQIQRLFQTGSVSLGSGGGGMSEALAQSIHALHASEPGKATRPSPIAAVARITLQRNPRTSVAGGTNGRSRRPQVMVALESIHSTNGNRGSWDTGWATSGPDQPPASEGRALPLDVQREVELKPVDPAAGADRDLRRAGLRALAKAPHDHFLTLGEVARLLHEAGGYEWLSESFTHVRVRAEALRGRQPVWRLLDQVAQAAGNRWRSEGTRIVFSNPRRAADRRREVPESFLAPWRARVARQRALSLDDLSAAVLALSEEQFSDLQQCWFWYMDEREIEFPSEMGLPQPDLWPLVRLWATLTPGQRRSATVAEGLSLRDLSREQQAILVSALSAPPGLNSLAIPGDPVDDLSWLADARFTVARSQTRRRVHLRGGGRSPIIGFSTGIVPPGASLGPRSDLTLEGEVEVFRFYLRPAVKDRGIPRGATLNLPQPLAPPGKKASRSPAPGPAERATTAERTSHRA
jgi:hypothetical protein